MDTVDSTRTLNFAGTLDAWDTLTVLRREFAAEEGTFLLTLRRDMQWDQAAFTRLEKAMRQACVTYAHEQTLERWMADGFYFVATWVPRITSTSRFQRPASTEYYRAAIERIQALGYWFFTGQSLFPPGHQVSDL